MADISTPIEAEWLDSQRTCAFCLSLGQRGRPLDQYLQFCNDVLAPVERSDFILGLRNAWPTLRTRLTNCCWLNFAPSVLRWRLRKTRKRPVLKKRDGSRGGSDEPPRRRAA
jgi:hypothetical protein